MGGEGEARTVMLPGCDDVNGGCNTLPLTASGIVQMLVRERAASLFPPRGASFRLSRRVKRGIETTDSRGHLEVAADPLQGVGVSLFFFLCVASSKLLLPLAYVL